MSNTAEFPTAVVTLLEMGAAYDNFATVTNGNSGGNISPTSTTISVLSATGAGPNCILTLGSGPTSEQVLIASVFGNVFTVASGGRGYSGTTAQSWTDPTPVEINTVAYPTNQMEAELVAIETALGASLGNVVLPARSVAGDGTTISGGGNLSANRTFSVIGNPVLAKTATYQVAAADFQALTTIQVASGTFTITLVASASQPAQGQYIRIINYGSGVVTVAVSGQQLNGGTTSLTLGAGSAIAPTDCYINSNGSNYFSSLSGAVQVAQAGTIESARQELNFIGGNGITATVADNSGSNRADITLAYNGSPINPQTGTYQVVAADFSSFKTITVASGTFTITLVASSSQPAQGQYIEVLNYGTGVVTIAVSGQNLNGGTGGITLTAGSATAPTQTVIGSDGSNYFATLSGGATSAPAFSGVQVYQTATLALSGSSLAVTWDSETYKTTSSYHSTSSNTSELIAPVTGYYRITAVVSVNTTHFTGLSANLAKNGTTLFSEVPAYSPLSGSPAQVYTVSINLTVHLSATDFINLLVQPEYSTGSTFDLGSPSYLEMVYLGS
jgi:hypothetical protein